MVMNTILIQEGLKAVRDFLNIKEVSYSKDKNNIELKGTNIDPNFKTTGSITSLIKTLVIEPDIIITRNAYQSKAIDSAIVLAVDLFTSFYMQAFQILTQLNGIAAIEAIDILSTNRYGKEFWRDKLKGAAVKTLDTTLKNKFSLDLNLSDHNSISIPVASNITPTLTLNQLNLDSVYSMLNLEKDSNVTIQGDWNTTTPDGVQSETSSLSGANLETLNGTYVKRFVLKIKQTKQVTMEERFTESVTGRDKINIDTDRYSDVLSDSDKTRLYKEDVDVTLELPMMVVANIKVVNTKEILDVVGTKDYKKTFKYRWNEYRSGGLSLGDLIFCKDLIKEYKNKRLSGSNSLLNKLNNLEVTSELRKLVTGAKGAEVSYNMVMVSDEDADIISKALKKDISTYNGKEEFLKIMLGHNLSILDDDTERLRTSILDLSGVIDIGYNRLAKKGDKDNNLLELMKYLFTNKLPTF